MHFRSGRTEDPLAGCMWIVQPDVSDFAYQEALEMFRQETSELHCSGQSLCLSWKQMSPMFSSTYSSNNSSVVIMTAVIKSNAIPSSAPHSLAPTDWNLWTFAVIRTLLCSTEVVLLPQVIHSAAYSWQKQQSDSGRFVSCRWRWAAGESPLVHFWSRTTTKEGGKREKSDTPDGQTLLTSCWDERTQHSPCLYV